MKRIAIIAGLMLTVLFTSEAQNELNPASTYAIPCPENVVFCGQTVDLSRSDLRERFDREIMADNYMHSASLLTIKRANRYFPVIEPILKAQGIPDDMKYLCCIESTLNPKAVSPSGAAGLWQFMEETGREYGLQVDKQVDERYDAVKSTEAACRYFRACYEEFKDWSLVAAAYNAGRRRIRTELAKQQETSYYGLWLNEETYRYVFRILAIKCFLEHPIRYGFKLQADDLYQPFSGELVSVSGPVADWAVFAHEHGITYSQLKEWNLWIRDTKMDNPKEKTFSVQIPAQAAKTDLRKLPYVHDQNWVVYGK